MGGVEGVRERGKVMGWVGTASRDGRVKKDEWGLKRVSGMERVVEEELGGRVEGEKREDDREGSIEQAEVFRLRAS